MSEDFHTHQNEELRRVIETLEGKNERLTAALQTARTQLLHMQEQLKQVNRPPHSMALFLRSHVASRQVDVIYSGKTMRLAAAPDLPLGDLTVGQYVRIDDKMVAIAADAMPRSGAMTSVKEVVGEDRVLVTSEHGGEYMLELAGPLRHGNLRPGDWLLADIRSGLALERVVRSDVEQLLTPEIPDTSYDDIGGLHEQIQQVRDAIELPLKHPELYRTYGLRPPKGILLYGPPGSGKTLIAKAVANSLSSRPGEKSYFLSIKGPELLNKFVGETERQIRAIFNRARTLASEDVPVVLFFDEMEALFRTRGSGISSDVETMVVPQLLAEMDGVESLDNVVIIGASNRADMIDPAVLRPGRLDVRIRVDRPDRIGAVEIFEKHLSEQVPLADGLDRSGLIALAVEELFSQSERTALLDAQLANGTTKRIYLHDVLSGALIAGIVERAKKLAIKDQLGGAPGGLAERHLMAGIAQERRESLDLATTTSPDEWARTIGLAQEIAAIHPIEGRS